MTVKTAFELLSMKNKQENELSKVSGRVCWIIETYDDVIMFAGKKKYWLGGGWESIGEAYRTSVFKFSKKVDFLKCLNMLRKTGYRGGTIIKE